MRDLSVELKNLGLIAGMGIHLGQRSPQPMDSIMDIILGARLKGGLGCTGGLGMGCKVGRESKGWAVGAGAGAAGSGAWGLLAAQELAARAEAAGGCTGRGCNGGAGTTGLCVCVGRPVGLRDSVITSQGLSVEGLDKAGLRGCARAEWWLHRGVRKRAVQRLVVAGGC
ncbi:hypothetical protein Acr_22g0009460 [Actinidia rufa]|uniref:Uncharacterized protein n=1 Tax=Actinidia rufa TaxID=165716 RepID=A0A7J0GLD8_9ERIC|nr:hypothetical protein Acr_22g0009460 [Actinidia rufa]